MKSLQPVVPEPFVMRDPFPHWSKPIRDEVVTAFATMPLLGDEAGIEQNAKMLRHSRTTHLEVACYSVDSPVFHCEQIQHLSPRRMTDRRKDIGFLLECCNHATSIGK